MQQSIRSDARGDNKSLNFGDPGFVLEPANWYDTREA